MGPCDGRPRWPLDQPLVLRADHNGLHALLLGTQGEPLNDDPLHFNYVAVAPGYGPYRRRGDLFVRSAYFGAPSQLLWSRINYFDAARIGAVELSRYLTPAQAAPALDKPPC